MGGVNFTRNRAWWHTAIWDEYGQRHQYVMIIPTFALLIPYYWYGAFMNRDLEQNYAAKMYELDYENKRNRLTHNLIMEHFETHVESTMDLLDEIKYKGFEYTFRDYLDTPLYTPVDLEMDGFSEEINGEKKAELNAYNEIEVKNDIKLKTWGLSLNTRNKIIDSDERRKLPKEPFKFLGVDIPISSSLEPISHYTPTPNIGKYTIKENEGEDEDE